MVKASITASVGIRYGTAQQLNLVRDQDTVARLLANISRDDGGFKERLASGVQLFPLLTQGKCSRELYDAIMYFQETQVMNGYMRKADGAVDPGAKTMQLLTQLASSLDLPDGKPKVQPPPAPRPAGVERKGSWNIVGASSWSLGEVGLLGGFSLQISQPDNRRFQIKTLGAGFGVSIDPSALLKSLPPGLASNPKMKEQILSMIAKGIGFSLGDFFQAIGIELAGATVGTIVPNPIRRPPVRPPMMRHELTRINGGSLSNIVVLSAGIAAGAPSAEAGVVFFNPGAFGSQVLSATAVGFYGSAAPFSLKFGASIQALLLAITSEDEL